jgi:thioredoxin-like negative regulator of GroEL
MQKNNLSESSSFRDIIKSDEAAELEMASRSALTKDQLLEKVGILAAKYQEDPNNLNVVKDLAATYEQLEDWASAQQFFDWAHQVSGGDVALRSKAEAMGDKSKALGIADLEAQAAADPDNADLQSQLVEIKAGRLDERLVECKQRVDQNPTDPKLRYELGYAFYDAGKHSEAIPHLQQATRNPHIRTKVLLLLGRTFYAKGMVDLAIKQLSDANAELIAMDSTKKEILFELGVIYHDADRKDEGLECFKQIYEIDYGYRDVAARVEGSYQG